MEYGLTLRPSLEQYVKAYLKKAKEEIQEKH